MVIVKEVEGATGVKDKRTIRTENNWIKLKHLLIIAVSLSLVVTVILFATDNKEQVIESDITISTDEMTTGFCFDRDGDTVIYNGTCEKIGLSIKAESVSNEGVTLIFSYDKNDAVGEGEIISGERYLIEKKHKDEWIPIEYSTNTIPEWIDIGWTIMNGEAYTVTWIDIYGKLEPGIYRIIKPIVCNHKIGEYKIFYIATEFSVNE